MKFWNIALGFGIGLLLFAGLVIRENQLFEIRSTLGDPFVDQLILEEKKTISDEKSQDFFLASGGFLRGYKGASLDFSNGKNEILSGDVFLSGGLKNPQKKEFIKVSNIFLEIAEKSVFLSIDPAGRFVDIFSVNGNVSVYSAIDEEPFAVIPLEQMASPRIENGYIQTDYDSPDAYFDLKKKWNMKSWKTHEKARHIESLHQMYVRWAEQFKPYSLNFIKAWSAGTPSGFFTKVVRGYKSLQSQYSVRFPEEKKNKLLFSQFLGLVSDGITSVEKDDLFSAKKFFLEFRSTVKKPLWKKFLSENDLFKNLWQQFEWSQKIWLTHAAPSLEKEVFSALWIPEPLSEESPAHVLEKNIQTISYFVSEKKFTKSFSGLKELQRNLANWKMASPEDQSVFSQENRAIVTKTRRIMGNFLLFFDAFQTEEAFEIYETLTQEEKKLYKEEALIKRQVEISQEIFLLIKNFIETQSEKSISEILIRLWKDQKVEEIEKSIGKVLFTDEEKELIGFIRIASSTALTQEDIDRIKEAELLEQEFEKGIEELTKNTQENEEEDLPKDTTIKNPKDLLEFLESKKIEVDLTNFKTNRETDTSSFSKAKFYDERIAGEFDYNSQRFLQFILNQSTPYDGIHKSFVDKILGKIEAQYEELAKKESEEKEEEPDDSQEFSEVSTDVLQNTEKAILTRRFVQNILANSYGFFVDRKNIFALDEEFVFFEVIFAEIFDIQFVRFTYDKINRTFANFKGKYTLKEIQADPENEIKQRSEEEVIIALPETRSWEELKSALKEEIQRLETKHLKKDETQSSLEGSQE